MTSHISQLIGLSQYDVISINERTSVYQEMLVSSCYDNYFTSQAAKPAGRDDLMKAISLLQLPQSLDVVEFIAGEWVTRFGHKVGQIGPKWDKSGIFSDKISVYFWLGV